MTLFLPEITETREAGPLSRADLDGAAWGACQIRLVADRVVSRRTGSTHKVYRGWRMAVVMDHGHPSPGTTLFSIPIDPTQLAASRSRYALVQLANQGVITVGDAAAFSWVTTSTGATDPVAVGLEEARRRLKADGWTRNAMVPTRYAKPDPTLDAGDVALGSPGPSVLAHRSMTISAQPASAELDGWETEGGTCV